MSVGTEQDFAAQLGATIDWWREAGIEHQFSDEPRGWIVAPDEIVAPEPSAAPRSDVPAAPPKLRVGGTRGGWPASLPEFAEWWLTEPSLDHGQIAARLAPRGQINAALMLMVDNPEVGDTAALLSGPQGRLLSAMLGAMGIAEEQVYLASALPRHTPMPDWAALQHDGLGEVLAHHIHLAAPQRLILFGRNVASLILSPLDNDPAKNAETSSHFNHEGTSVPVLAARGLEMLLAKPQAKAKFWQRWLEWTGTKST